MQSKIVNPGRRHQVEMWSLSSFKTRGLRAKEPTEEKIKEEEKKMRDF
jgi:hypothetical protein